MWCISLQINSSPIFIILLIVTVVRKKEQTYPYLIFVISFTQAKFRRIKFTPKNMYTKGVNCQIITQKRINFAFILGKFTLDRKNLHRHCRWCRWQIWGMDLYRNLFFCIFVEIRFSLELITFEILAAERLRLMEFDSRLIGDYFANIVILLW